MDSVLCGTHFLEFILSSSSPICALVHLSLRSLFPRICPIPSLLLPNQDFLDLVPADTQRCALLVIESSDMPNFSEPMRIFMHSSQSRDLITDPWKNDYVVEMFIVNGQGFMAKYVVCPRSVPQVEYIAKNGIWSKIRSIKCPSILAARGGPVRISYVGVPPYVSSTEGQNPQGIDLDIMRYYAEAMDFSIEYVAETAWLEFDKESETFDGMIQAVANRSSDIGTGHQMIVYAVFEFVDFVHFSYPLDLNMVVAKPKILKQYWNMARPFSPLIWTGLTLTFLCVVLAAILVMTLMYPNLDTLLTRRQESSGILAWVSGILLSQNVLPSFSKSKALNLIIVFWVFFAMVIVQFYECNLRANLIAVDFEKPIQTIQDLLDRGLILHLPGGYTFIDVFKMSGSAAERAMAAEVEKGNFFLEMNEDRVIAEEVEMNIAKRGDAFVISGLMAQAAFPTFAKRHNGVLPYQVSKVAIAYGVSSPMIPKKAPYSEDLNRVALYLGQAGMAQYLAQIYIEAKYLDTTYSDLKQDHALDPLNVDQILLPMMILACGIFVSAIAACLELGLKKKP